MHILEANLVNEKLQDIFFNIFSDNSRASLMLFIITIII